MLDNVVTGILFIGDPHVSSRRPGRRKDDYLSSVLEKLSFCAEIANKKGMQAVITGDLFHRSDDNNLAMLNRLTDVLKGFDRVPYTLPGNHDRALTELSNTDALSLLIKTGLVRLLDENPVSLTVAKQQVRLHGCPHGKPLPERLSDNLDTLNILVSHHDLAMGKSYPGAIEPQPIANCPMVVNGHMHDTKPALLCGDTWYFNPGNIEPLSVDLIDHVPRAWSWTPVQMKAPELQSHDLPHGSDIFDLTGLRVEAGDAMASVRALDGGENRSSAFASLLCEQTEGEAQRTSDATVLKEDLAAVLASIGVSEATETLLKGLAERLTTSPMP